MAALPAGLPGKYFIANAQESTGICLQHAHDLLFSPQPLTTESYAQMEQLAHQVPAGSRGLLYTPWINGE